MVLIQLNAIEQVATNTLCCVQYCIYGVIHMQLYATDLHVKFPHTFQRGEQNANVAFHPFVDKWRMLIPFATYLQLFYN